MPKSKSDLLMIAIRKGDAEKVERILDPDNKADDSIHPNMSADSAKNGILHRAARYGHNNVVKTLLQMGADPNLTNKFGMSPLHHAAVGGDHDIIKTLVKAGSNSRAKDDSGRTPLHWVSGYGFVDAVRVLLEHGAKAEAVDKDGWTPLHRCCQEKPVNRGEENNDEEGNDECGNEDCEDTKRAEIAKMLIAHGANAKTTEPKGHQTPLHLCAMNGYDKTCAVLIKKGKANLDAVNRISQTPLMYACAEDHLDTIRVLLENRADTEIPNKIHWDWTALHTAVLQDNVKAVDMLIEHGADADKRDAVGRTAKMLAEEHRKMNVLSTFRSRKSKH